MIPAADKTDNVEKLPSRHKNAVEEKGAALRPSEKLNFKRMVLQIFLMALVLALAVIVVRWMMNSTPKASARPPFERFIAVETVRAEIKTNQPKFTAYGTVIAGKSVEIRSSVSGEIMSLNPNLKVGSSVQKGEELLKVDDFAYQGALREAEANLLQTRAGILENEASIISEQQKLDIALEQLKFAEDDLERAQKLRKNGTFTQTQVDDKKLLLSQRRSTVQNTQSALKIAKARLEGQKASLSRLEWRLEEAKRNLEHTIFYAPFSGIISKSNADVGRLLTANEVVTSLYDAENLEVKFTISDDQFGRLQNDDENMIGREIKVIWRVGEESFDFAAVISRIGAEIEAKRGGVDVYASFNEAANAFEIRPGAFVELSIPDKKFENTVRVPDSAIYDNARAYVIEGEHLKERKIEVLLYDGEYAIIGSGLKSGERVLTTRIAQISNDLKVKEYDEPKEGGK